MQNSEQTIGFVYSPRYEKFGLEEFKRYKLKLLRRDFCFRITLEEEKTILDCDTVSVVEAVFRGILSRKLEDYDDNLVV